MLYVFAIYTAKKLDALFRILIRSCTIQRETKSKNYQSFILLSHFLVDFRLMMVTSVNNLKAPVQVSLKNKLLWSHN